MNRSIRLTFVLLILVFAVAMPCRAQFQEIPIPQGLAPGFYYYFLPGDQRPSLHCVPHPFGYVPEARTQPIRPLPVIGQEYYPVLSFDQLNRVTQSNLAELTWRNKQKAQLAPYVLYPRPGATFFPQTTAYGQQAWLPANPSWYNPNWNTAPQPPYPSPTGKASPQENSIRQEPAAGSSQMTEFIPQQSISRQNASAGEIKQGPGIIQPLTDNSLLNQNPETRKPDGNEGSMVAYLTPSEALIPVGVNSEDLKRVTLNLDDLDDLTIARMNSAADLLDEASKLIATKNFEQASGVLIDAARLDPNPNSGTVHYNLGLCHGKQGNYHKAIAQFEKSLEFEPDKIDTINSLAHCYEKVERADEAILLLQKGYRAQPQSSDTVARIARCHQIGGRLNLAMSWYSKYLALEPDAKDRKEVEALIVSMQQTAAETATDRPGSSDYYASAVCYGTFRWPLQKLPLKVYIDNGKKTKNFREHYKEMMVEAFDAWSKASGGRLAWKLVKSKRKADIVCKWASDMSELKGGRGIEAHN
jgi:tetratricopeptide (TPR) repeat protein